MNSWNNFTDDLKIVFIGSFLATFGNATSEKLNMLNIKYTELRYPENGGLISLLNDPI